MTAKPKALALYHGQRIQVQSALGETRIFTVMIGDALQWGKSEQYWLYDLERHEYLRMLPAEPGNLGRALFYSQEELLECIEYKWFYFG